MTSFRIEEEQGQVNLLCLWLLLLFLTTAILCIKNMEHFAHYRKSMRVQLYAWKDLKSHSFVAAPWIYLEPLGQGWCGVGRHRVCPRAQYLGLMDCHLDTSHSLAFSVELDLDNPTELSQNCCEVVFQEDTVNQADTVFDYWLDMANLRICSAPVVSDRCACALCRAGRCPAGAPDRHRVAKI
ncbi:hypothetical protein EYF80_037718 [Liparis tanakae]|uniref:Uncharacterized protein n=1 Tax=Liparis tanakae TaxID=230148 RepID=A0A4Z2GES5_9TELE|nr:hypothetical protein EYF80_037718 [Liparis tanakae]